MAANSPPPDTYKQAADGESVEKLKLVWWKHREAGTAGRYSKGSLVKLADPTQTTIKAGM